MKNKLHSTEEIIRVLRQADSGQAVESVCREHNLSEASSSTFEGGEGAGWHSTELSNPTT